VGALCAKALVRGGVGAFAQALAGAARRYGATIRTGAEVTRIIVRGDAATGVALPTGEEIHAPLVLSSEDPRNTLLGLVGASELDPELVHALRNIKYKGVVARVNLALGELPHFRGRSEGSEQLHGAVSIAPTVKHIEKAYDAAKHRRIPDSPWIEARIPSLHDHSLAPQGKHVMSVHLQYAPYSLDGGWTDARREEIADLAIRTLAEYAPNLPGAVIHRQVLTPEDLERDFALPEGNFAHGEMTLDQILFMRPVPEVAQYATPIDGLFLCGPGTHPGPNLPGISALNAVRVALATSRRAGAARSR
jgi:phytoene dehydrogenase-like protein